MKVDLSSVHVSIDEDDVENVGTHVTQCSNGEEDYVDHVDDYGEDNDTGLDDDGKERYHEACYNTVID